MKERRNWLILSRIHYCCNWELASPWEIKDQHLVRCPQPGLDQHCCWLLGPLIILFCNVQACLVAWASGLNSDNDAIYQPGFLFLDEPRPCAHWWLTLPRERQRRKSLVGQGKPFVREHGKEGAAPVFNFVQSALSSRARTWKKSLFRKNKSFVRWVTKVRKANSLYYFHWWKIILFAISEQNILLYKILILL